MQLNLELSPEWSVGPVPGGRAARHEASKLVIVVSAIVPLPEDQHGWRTAALRANLPPDAVVEPLTTDDTTTDVGWPIRMVEAAVVVGGQQVERRLACFYHLLEHACVVLVCGPREALDAQREVVRSILMSGRPSWATGEVAAISQLWA